MVVDDKAIRAETNVTVGTFPSTALAPTVVENTVAFFPTRQFVHYMPRARSVRCQWWCDIEDERVTIVVCCNLSSCTTSPNCLDWCIHILL